MVFNIIKETSGGYPGFSKGRGEEPVQAPASSQMLQAANSK